MTVPTAIFPAPTPRAPLAGPATRQLAFAAELFPPRDDVFSNPPARPNATDDASDGELDGELDGVAVHARRRRRSRVGTIVERGGEKEKVAVDSLSKPPPPLRLDFFVDGLGPVDVRDAARYRRTRATTVFPRGSMRLSRGTTRGDAFPIPRASSPSRRPWCPRRARRTTAVAHLTTRRWPARRTPRSSGPSAPARGRAPTRRVRDVTPRIPTRGGGRRTRTAATCRRCWRDGRR